MPTRQNGQNTETIRRQQPMNCLSVFDHFVELTLKGLEKKRIDIHTYLKFSLLSTLLDSISEF